MNARGAIEEAVAPLGRYESRSEGYVRRALVDAGCGSVHQAVSVCTLEPGGRVERHAHAFEEAVYLLDGELSLGLGAEPERLGPAEYAFLQVGVTHELANVGHSSVRWIEVGAPQPGAAGLEDTIFTSSAPNLGEAPSLPRGRFDEASLPPPSGQILEGFGEANVAGASLVMLIDRDLGASQFNLFVVQYVPGGAIKAHDHPFEEAYVFLAGEIEARFGDETHVLRAGDWCWTAVGEPHAFANRSNGPVRWLETQVPQPPGRHQARFFEEWSSRFGGADAQS